MKEYSCCCSFEIRSTIDSVMFSSRVSVNGFRFVMGRFIWGPFLFLHDFYLMRQPPLFFVFTVTLFLFNATAPPFFVFTVTLFSFNATVPPFFVFTVTLFSFNATAPPFFVFTVTLFSLMQELLYFNLRVRYFQIGSLSVFTFLFLKL